MTNTMLRINGERMRADFDALAQIGATGDGGVHRPTFSDAHLSARKWFRAQIEKAGLAFRTDGAGNHSGILTCERSSAQTLLLGSHLDSVPNGGRFDGALGVCAALEVLRVVKENHLSLSTNLEAIDFTDEEGTLVGFIGSAGIAGKLKSADLQNPRSGRANLEAGLARAGLTEAGLFTAARPRESIAGYLELHIEQGRRLVNAQKNIGIVTDIVGIGSYRLKFIGRADHAGTMPVHERRDAGQGASSFNRAVREIIILYFPQCVANVGKMEFVPGAFNIVPASVTVSLEFRAPKEDDFARLDAALIESAKVEAHRFGVMLESEFLGKHAPTPLSDKVQRAFIEGCDILGLTHIPLVSGAGHDAQSFADLWEAGMIFVPSVEGVSHSAREFTEWQDCVNGANVLLQAAIKLAS